MIETTVESIRVSLVTQNRVVILKENDGDRHLPIWIGAYEAEAIAMELQGTAATRPLPYDLMRTMLNKLGARVEQVVIADLNDQVFYARIIVEHDGVQIELDARPSDAIALAVRTGVRIMVADAIMDQAGISMEDDDADSELTPTNLDGRSVTSESPAADATAPKGGDQLGAFRDFINSLDLDDFDRKR